jgi:hypothetical protein
MLLIGPTSRAEGVGEPAPDDRASNSQHDIEENSFSPLVGDFAADETCRQTLHGPGQVGHFVLSLGYKFRETICVKSHRPHDRPGRASEGRACKNLC